MNFILIIIFATISAKVMIINQNSTFGCKNYTADLNEIADNTIILQNITLLLIDNCTYIIANNSTHLGEKSHEIYPEIIVVVAVILLIFLIIIAAKIINYRRTHGKTTTQLMHKYQRVNFA